MSKEGGMEVSPIMLLTREFSCKLWVCVAVSPQKSAYYNGKEPEGKIYYTTGQPNKALRLMAKDHKGEKRIGYSM